MCTVPRDGPGVSFMGGARLRRPEAPSLIWYGTFVSLRGGVQGRPWRDESEAIREAIHEAIRVWVFLFHKDPGRKKSLTKVEEEPERSHKVEEEPLNG